MLFSTTLLFSAANSQAIWTTYVNSDCTGEIWSVSKSNQTQCKNDNFCTKGTKKTCTTTPLTSSFDAPIPGLPFSVQTLYSNADCTGFLAQSSTVADGKYRQVADGSVHKSACLGGTLQVSICDATNNTNCEQLSVPLGNCNRNVTSTGDVDFEYFEKIICVDPPNGSSNISNTTPAKSNAVRNRILTASVFSIIVLVI